MNEKNTKNLIENKESKTELVERFINLISAAITVFQTFFAFPNAFLSANTVPYLQNFQYSLRVYIFITADIASAYFIAVLLKWIDKIGDRQTYNFLYLILIVASAFISISFIDVIVFKGEFLILKYLSLYILSYAISLYFIGSAEKERSKRILAEQQIKGDLNKHDDFFAMGRMTFLVTFFYVVMFISHIRD